MPSEGDERLEGTEVYVESRLTQYLFDKAVRQKVPLNGTFELSPLCNFRCKMCYVVQNEAQIAKAGRSGFTAKQWLKLAEEARDAGMLMLLLTGGEPFLWPEFFELYHGLSGMGLQISINSNGSMIDRKTVEELAKRPPTRINITLYGASEETYGALCGNPAGYARTVEAIDMLREAGISINPNCSLTPWNCHDLDRMAAFAQERKLIFEVNTYMFPPMRRAPELVGQNQRFTPEEAAYWHLYRYGLQHDAEQYQLMLAKVRDGLIPPPGLDETCVDPATGTVRCRAGRASFWVTWDGFMTPCGMVSQPQCDLHTHSFQQAWEQTLEATEKLTTSSVCETCPNQSMCHSCMAIAAAETGKTQGVPQYLCRMMESMKEQAEKLLTLMNKK